MDLSKTESESTKNGDMIQINPNEDGHWTYFFLAKSIIPKPVP